MDSTELSPQPNVSLKDGYTMELCWGLGKKMQCISFVGENDSQAKLRQSTQQFQSGPYVQDDGHIIEIC